MCIASIVKPWWEFSFPERHEFERQIDREQHDQRPERVAKGWIERRGAASLILCDDSIGRRSKHQRLQRSQQPSADEQSHDTKRQFPNREAVKEITNVSP